MTAPRRRQFLQATAAALALGGASSTAAAEDGGTAAATGYGEGGYGMGGYGGASPFSTPVGNSAAKPTDPDGDGDYEDVDGDGSLTVADVQALYHFRTSAAVQNNADLLDFEGEDGDVDVFDALELFEEFVDGR